MTTAKKLIKFLKALDPDTEIDVLSVDCIGEESAITYVPLIPSFNSGHLRIGLDDSGKKFLSIGSVTEIEPPNILVPNNIKMTN